MRSRRKQSPPVVRPGTYTRISWDPRASELASSSARGLRGALRRLRLGDQYFEDNDNDVAERKEVGAEAKALLAG